MSVESILRDAEKVVRKVVPKDVEITEIELEGPVVVIYTKSMEEFAENNDIVRQLAQGMRRRVAIRPDPSLLAPTAEAEESIREIIPEDAKITDIYFEHENGEVTIDEEHAEDPSNALKVQDVVLPESCGVYLVKATRFTDDLLTKFYEIEPFYGIDDPIQMDGCGCGGVRGDERRRTGVRRGNGCSSRSSAGPTIRAGGFYPNPSAMYGDIDFMNHFISRKQIRLIFPLG